MAMTATYTNFLGQIVHENSGGTERGYVPDPLGSTIALVDNESGEFSDTWEYWPYGEVASHTGSSTTPFTFVGTLGYFKDAVSKLTYIRARFYQALIGQWMAVDSIWPKAPAYRYSHSSPVALVDPAGTYTEKECEIIHDGWIEKCNKKLEVCLLACGIPAAVLVGCIAACIAPEPISKAACLLCLGLAALLCGGCLMKCLNDFQACRDRADKWYIRCLRSVGVK
jgi:RHS repeat-associated protein